VEKSSGPVEKYKADLRTQTHDLALELSQAQPVLHAALDAYRHLQPPVSVAQRPDPKLRSTSTRRPAICRRPATPPRRHQRRRAPTTLRTLPNLERTVRDQRSGRHRGPCALPRRAISTSTSSSMKVPLRSRGRPPYGAVCRYDSRGPGSTSGPGGGNFRAGSRGVSHHKKRRHRLGYSSPFA
jgi:hypothetical protein